MTIPTDLDWSQFVSSHRTGIKMTILTDLDRSQFVSPHRTGIKMTIPTDLYQSQSVRLHRTGITITTLTDLDWSQFVEPHSAGHRRANDPGHVGRQRGVQRETQGAADSAKHHSVVTVRQAGWTEVAKVIAPKHFVDYICHSLPLTTTRKASCWPTADNRVGITITIKKYTLLIPSIKAVNGSYTNNAHTKMELRLSQWFKVLKHAHTYPLLQLALTVLMRQRYSSTGGVSYWKARCNSDVGSSLQCGKGFFYLPESTGEVVVKCCLMSSGCQLTY